MTISKLRYVTFTGVDDFTDLNKLQAFQKHYPFAEFGLLWHPRKMGQGRYPGKKQFQAFMECDPLNLAVHICSEEGIRQALVKGRFDRMRTRYQFNLTSNDLSPANADYFNQFCFDHPMTTFILQENATKHEFNGWITAPNVHYLLDPSGGRGDRSWLEKGHPLLLLGKWCGFAGGLGPDTIEQDMPRLAAYASFSQKEFWIDMESNIRTPNASGGDRFDLDKCERVCKFLWRSPWSRL